MSWTPKTREREYARQRERRSYQRDDSVPMGGLARVNRTDLGLAIFSCHALPGISYTRAEIAVWCGCTESAIWMIEKRAIKKLCNTLRFRNRALFEELAIAFFERRSDARRRPLPNEWRVAA